MQNGVSAKFIAPGGLAGELAENPTSQAVANLLLIRRPRSMFVMMACFCKRRVHLFFHLKIRCVGARLTADIEAKGKAAIILHRRNDLVAVYRLAAPRRGTLTADAYGEAAAGGWLEDVMAAQSRSDFAFRESGFDLGADELTFGRMSGSLRLHFFL